MNWTNNKPSVAGWYWWLADGPQIRRADGSTYFPGLITGQFAGPIPEPSECDRVFDEAMALAGAKRCPKCGEWITHGAVAGTCPR
jgi:hypothetical protein